MIVFPERVESDWWRKRGHELNPRDIGDILDYGPEVLVVGTGSSGMMDVSKEVEKLLDEHDIDLITEKTEKATEIYNKLRNEKKVVAALHLTC